MVIQTQRFLEAQVGFDLAEDRFNLYKSHFEDAGIDGLPGRVPSKESLDSAFLIGELSENYASHIRQTWNRVIESRVDLHGQPLPLELDCELQIVSDLHSMVADVGTDQVTGKSVVRISTGTLLLIDIMSGVFHLGFRSEQSMLRWESSYFSDEIELFVGVPWYLSYFCHFVSTANDVEKHTWTYSTENSLEWIIRHELGHLLCGHVGYLSTLANEPNLRERAIIYQLTREEVIYGSSTPLVRYSAELLADGYATISMLLDSLRGHEFDDDDLDRGRRCNILNHSMGAVTMSMVVPLMIFQLPEIADWRNRGKHDSDTHPKVISRLLGAFSAVAYILDPPSDVRKDPYGFEVRRLISDIYEEPKWHFVAHMYLHSSLVVTLKSLAANGLLGKDTKEEYEAGTNNLNLSTFLSACIGRFGANLPENPNEPMTDAQDIIETSYAEWAQIFQSTGGRLCAFFIHHFDSTILRDGRIVDPTYYVLNEWLEKAQLSSMGVTEFHGYTMDQELARIQNLVSSIDRYHQR